MTETSPLIIDNLKQQVADIAANGLPKFEGEKRLKDSRDVEGRLGYINPYMNTYGMESTKVTWETADKIRHGYDQNEGLGKVVDYIVSRFQAQRSEMGDDRPVLIAAAARIICRGISSAREYEVERPSHNGMRVSTVNIRYKAHFRPINEIIRTFTQNLAVELTGEETDELVERLATVEDENKVSPHRLAENMMAVIDFSGGELGERSSLAFCNFVLGNAEAIKENPQNWKKIKTWVNQAKPKLLPIDRVEALKAKILSIGI